MKKIVVFCLAIIMILCLAACDSSDFICCPLCGEENLENSRFCSNCGAEIGVTSTNDNSNDTKCKHRYTSKITIEATCNKEGIKTFTCSMCKDSYQESIDAGHKWIDATCTAPRTCSACSFTEGNPLGHTNDNGICNRCGINNTKPLVYTGYGQDVITGVNVPYGLYRVIMTNSGKEHFSVITYDEDGNYDDLLANTSGSAFVGEALYREGEIQATTGWSFEIDSESNWTITIEPINEQITSNIKGFGSVVTDFFSGQGLAAVAMTNSGKEHFSVIIYDNQGNYIKLLANDSGNAFSGKAAVTLKPEKQYFLVIDSESEWTINFGFEDKTTEYYDNK